MCSAREQNENPTNIYRLFAMTKRASSDGAQQIAFYDPGIGVVSNLQNQPLFDRLWNIREKIKGGLFGKSQHPSAPRAFPDTSLKMFQYKVALLRRLMS